MWAVIISGPLSVGKSTVAKLLHKHLHDWRIVEGDFIREDKFAELDIAEAAPKVVEDIIGTLNNSDRNLIVEYTLSEQQKQEIDDSTSNRQLLFVTLDTDKDEIINRSDARNLSEWERERIEYHFSIGINTSNLGVVIDSTNKNPAKIAEEIHKILTKERNGKETT